MKKSLLFAVVMLAGILGLSSCDKDDTTPPVVVLNGKGSIVIPLNSVYVDSGAVSQDDIDGSDVITSDVSPTNPNVNLAGTYTIHYYSTDNGGNTGTTQRTVIVRNEAYLFDSTYVVRDSVVGKYAGKYTYKVTVTPSTTVNNQVLLKGFPGLGGNVTVLATISAKDSTINIIKQQRPIGMPDPGVFTTGGGNISGSKIKTLNYTINYDAGIDDNGFTTW